MTPGVARQWCGETGKVGNCVVGQHLLYSDNHPTNPFNCTQAGDLFLPEAWSKDRERCRKAHIPDEVIHRPKWRIVLDSASDENTLGHVEGGGQGGERSPTRFHQVALDFGDVPLIDPGRRGQGGLGDALLLAQATNPRPDRLLGTGLNNGRYFPHGDMMPAGELSGNIPSKP
jgi:hypothetical protein